MGEFFVFNICPICGKRFHIPYVDNWAYKTYYKRNSDVPMCSWKCMRMAQSMSKQVKSMKRGG